MNTFSPSVVVLLLLTVSSLFAQPATSPATLPATAPTTVPARPPHRIMIPPGFVKVQASERVALCEPADKEWVTKAMDELQPTARPSTMPSDLAHMLRLQRDALVKQISTDLGIADTASIAKLFDEQLIPDLEKMADIRPPMQYMVCSKEKLLELVIGGWSDPRFYYNRAANDVAIRPNIDLSIQHAMDDLLIPALYDPKMDLAAKRDILQKQIDTNEANIAASLSMQGQIMLQSGLVAAIDEAVVRPLQLKTGQEWFGIGIEGLLSTRYMAQVNGMRNEDLMRVLTNDDPRNPIRAATVDLIHPIPPNQLRQGYAPAYVDALRRRSVLVVNSLIQRAPDAVPKVIAAIKQEQPKDGEALVELIKKTTTVDLSRDVQPQN